MFKNLSQYLRQSLTLRLALAMLFILPPPLWAQQTRRPIVIASKNFTENRLLAEIMAQLIEQETGIPVERRFSLGATLIVFEAMQKGDVDLYPDYTGTGWAILLGIERPVRDKLEAFTVVEYRMREEHGLRWLAPFGFYNSFALAMANDRAEELNIESISDLIPHQDELSIALSPQFSERQDGYPGLAKAYGFEFDNKRIMEHGLAYKAIGSGKVDLVDTWTTDGKLSRMDMRILEDDRSFFPPYDAAPVIRQETLDEYPELQGVLHKLAWTIDNEKMQDLNRRVEEGETVADVARHFLDEMGVEVDQTASEQRRENFFSYMWQHRRDTLFYVLQHLYLVGIAMGLAIAVSVPTGIALTRWKTASPLVLGIAGVIQTIPSLALLMFMIPFLGLGAAAAIAGLFLYAILPILRNTYTGIMEVDEHLIEAATAIGMRSHEILFKVELPLATRTIMAGIRTSTVIGIGVATLAAFIGGGGLGEPIVIGLQLADTNMIMAGAIPAAGLALLVDYLLGWIEWLVRPRGVGDG